MDPRRLPERAIAEEPQVSGAAGILPKPAGSKTFSMRSRWQIAAAVACAAGVLYGARMQGERKTGRHAFVTEEALAGSWLLQSVDGRIVGSKGDILFQKATFRNGLITGETRLKALSEIATEKLPFPDQSVRKATLSEDGSMLVVLWSGSYRIVEGRALEFQIGTAFYRVLPTLHPHSRSLEMDTDAILTYRGPARYVAAPPSGEDTAVARKN